MIDNPAAKNIEVVKVLEICRDIELVNAELYKFFAEIFSDDEEMANLWRKTAGEEENHALQFAMAINLRREQTVDTLFVDAGSAESALAYVRSINALVRESRPTMLEALRLAITLEINLSKFHMTAVGHFVEDGYKKLFAALMNADNNHLEALRVYYQRLLSP